MQRPDLTIVSQYSASPAITRLCQDMNLWFDPAANFQAFYDLVWNVDTARGVGLDIWGRIVGVGRVLNISTGVYFGFAEAGDSAETPFNQAPLYAGAPTTSNYALSDDAFRTLIFAKALSNICNGSIPAINQILLNLFPGRGNCYVTDGLDMSMTYHFEFILTPVETAIVSQSGILPKPVGVSATVVQV